MPSNTKRSVGSDREPRASELSARIALIEQSGLTIRWLIVSLAIAFIAYCVLESIKSLAGKETSANVLVHFFNQVEVNVAIAWGLAAGAVLYGRAERKLRQRTVAKLHGDVKELELRLDPKRSSSKLTKTGDTNPKDR